MLDSFINMKHVAILRLMV